MLIIPAIDIRGGHVVRLFKGDFAAETIYDQDPVAVAQRWVAQGAKYLHIVDLDGARTGALHHWPNIERLAAAIAPSGAQIEVGGGIRSLEAVQELLGAGVDRVVLGTRAFQDPEFRRQVLRDYGERVAIAVDAQDGLVATDGWRIVKVDARAMREDTEASFVTELLKEGVHYIIYTDITKDGTLAGPAFDRIHRLIDQVAGRARIIASGGVASLDDLRQLKQAGVYGAIIGKALYEQKFALAEALAL